MQNHGKRNLIILGLVAVAITAATTFASLWVYRSSGDIYLDRSRPGFLPDSDEAEDDNNITNTFVFSDTGELTATDLDDYLKELKTINDRLKALSDPYSLSPLSDESLGITKTTEPADQPEN